jgi:hypothetical protein
MDVLVVEKCTYAEYTLCLTDCVGQESSEDIATRYWLDGPGREIFRTSPNQHWGPHNFLYIG